VHSNTHNRLDKAMTTEQFTQVVDAILAGKYSWACVLVLRFAGYNPLHYIPYRTYNRLMKENAATMSKSKETTSSHSAQVHAQNHSHRITDLSYLESLDDQYSRVRGGDRSSDFLSLHGVLDLLRSYHQKLYH
jgi:hypothetical protein